MTDKELIEHLSKTNDNNYTISKTIEELNELATVLGQYVNKPHKRDLYLKNISKEIADVHIRLKLLKKHFKNYNEIKDALRTKLDTYKEYVKLNKYTGKI